MVMKIILRLILTVHQRRTSEYCIINFRLCSNLITWEKELKVFRKLQNLAQSNFVLVQMNTSSVFILHYYKGAIQKCDSILSSIDCGKIVKLNPQQIVNLHNNYRAQVINPDTSNNYSILSFLYFVLC